VVAGARQGHELPQAGGWKLELRRQGPSLQQLSNIAIRGMKGPEELITPPVPRIFGSTAGRVR